MSSTRSTFVRFTVVVLVAAASLALVGVRRAWAAFPGANGLIAFHTNRDGNFEIYTMNADGTNPVNRTNNAAGQDTNPVWDPAGRLIAFTSDRDGNLEIYVMNDNGTGLTRLTNDPATDTFPFFCDPENVLFASDRDGDFEIYQLSIETGALTQLTDHSAADLQPTCRADGKKTAFSTNRDGNSEIYEMDRDGTDPVNLTQNPAADLDPDYSPDGSELFFASDRDGNLEIFRMDLGPTPAPYSPAGAVDAEQVTETTAPIENAVPRVDPDGQSTLFTRRDASGEADVMRQNLADMRPAEKLTNLDADDSAGMTQPRVKCFIQDRVLMIEGTNGDDRAELLVGTHPPPPGLVLFVIANGDLCGQFFPVKAFDHLFANGGLADDMIVNSISLPSRLPDLELPEVRVLGGPGDDRLVGSTYDERLDGGPGIDVLTGGKGEDVLVGGKGPDTINGGAGNDRILARDKTADTVIGGTGRDEATVDKKKDVVKGVEQLV